MNLWRRPIVDQGHSATGYPVFLAGIWLCFMIRGFFYASVLPLWEGYDEWAHFAYLDHVLEHRQLPDRTVTRVPREVAESLQLVPLPWATRDLPFPHVTHDEYWRLPEGERRRRQECLMSLPPSQRKEAAADAPLLYEAQQPPLYYWLMSLPLRLADNSSLPARVYVARYLGVALASLAIPFGFLAARRVFGGAQPALGIAALIAALPEFMIDICRVGNECLAVVWYSALILLLFRYSRPAGGAREAVAVGLVSGLGLLTKAYFLTALPALALIIGIKARRSPGRRMAVLGHLALVLGVALAISGWWYHHNRMMTGSWSGEQQEATLQGLSLPEMLARVPEVNWAEAGDSAFCSHIWFGAWSFLQLRWWMYHLFRYLYALAVAGLCVDLLRRWRRRGTCVAADFDGLFVPLCLYGFFLAGMAYHVLITFTANQVSATTGWYIYALVVAEAILAGAGWIALAPPAWRRHVLTGAIMLLSLLDLYGMHFLIVPYYTGVIAHTPGGALETLHIGDLWSAGIGPTLERLTVHKPAFLTAPVLFILWILYLCSTIGLDFFGIRTTSPGTACAARCRAGADRRSARPDGGPYDPGPPR